MNSPKELSPSEKMRAAIPEDKSVRRAPPLMIFLLGLMTTVLLVGALLSVVALWWFRPMTSENPERARKLTQEIVTITVPDSFVPRGTIEWNVGFLMRLRGVYYQRLVGDGVLSLLEVKTSLANDDSARRQIRETLLEESSTGAALVVDPAKSQKETIEILGEPVLFHLDIARDPRTNETYRLIEGVFQGNSGQVLLAMRVDSNRWLDEALPLDSLTSSEPEGKLPNWLMSMLKSIGRGESAENSGGTSSTPPIATPDAIPALAPAPAPGPLQ